MKYKYHILLFLFLISLASSLVLSFTPVSLVCNFNVGCDVVHYSNYNFTFGIQNSHYGVVIFALGAFLIYSHIKEPNKNKKLIIYLAVILGALVAFYFLYIQQFILGVYCKYCLVVDFSLLASLIVILIKWKE